MSFSTLEGRREVLLAREGLVEVGRRMAFEREGLGTGL
jgi:hypothetical protein